MPKASSTPIEIGTSILVLPWRRLAQAERKNTGRNRPAPAARSARKASGTGRASPASAPDQTDTESSMMLLRRSPRQRPSANQLGERGILLLGAEIEDVRLVAELLERLHDRRRRPIRAPADRDAFGREIDAGGFDAREPAERRLDLAACSRRNGCRAPRDRSGAADRRPAGSRAASLPVRPRRGERCCARLRAPRPVRSSSSSGSNAVSDRTGLDRRARWRVRAAGTRRSARASRSQGRSGTSRARSRPRPASPASCSRPAPCSCPSRSARRVRSSSSMGMEKALMAKENAANSPPIGAADDQHRPADRRGEQHPAIWSRPGNGRSRKTAHRRSRPQRIQSSIRAMSRTPANRIWPPPRPA